MQFTGPKALSNRLSHFRKMGALRLLLSLVLALSVAASPELYSEELSLRPLPNGIVSAVFF